ncbi:MAG: pantetheine-phosphate adenylyltransferase [Candidatus Deianiraeaceae bacterium]|jgi:pantetheine-phosphate adenylyltransferase
MKAIYPGTFDPITLGHIDIISKAYKIFGNVTIAIAEDNNKSCIFASNKRQEFIKIAMQECDLQVEVVIFKGLLVNFMQEQEAHIIIRGLRAISDFEYEFQMSCINTRLNKNIQTVFLPAKDDMHFVSSKIIRSVAELHGDISAFVPQCVVRALKEYYQ